MVKEVKIKGGRYFRCKFCSFLYREKKFADEYEDFCKKYNLQIKKFKLFRKRVN